MQEQKIYNKADQTAPVITGILLAGGQSRRMGTDKAELSYAGIQQLSSTRQLLHDAGCSEVIVSRNQPDGVADIYPNQGPLAGIHAALQNRQDSDQNRAPLALVVPVDMPLLQVEDLKTLITEALFYRANTYFDDCYLPCALHINSETIKDIEQKLLSGQRSVKGFLNDPKLQPQTLPLTPSNPQLLLNTNTPQEWQQACNLRQSNA